MGYLGPSGSTGCLPDFGLIEFLEDLQLPEHQREWKTVLFGVLVQAGGLQTPISADFSHFVIFDFLPLLRRFEAEEMFV